MLTPLKQVVRGWKPAAAKADPLLVISAAWPGIVGEDVAQNSRPVEISGTTLLVVTRSSSWSQQLSFLAERILNALAAEVPASSIERIRFRVGRVRVPTASGAKTRAAVPARSRTFVAEPSATVDEALARFRADVSESRRAKSGEAWKECRGCGLPLGRQGPALCAPCACERADAKARMVSQLLFEAPWLGYAGIAPLTGELSIREYEAIRRRLLRAWWQTLARAQKSGREAATRHVRLIASSYVLLKSGLDPEQISPVVVRNLLGDELHDLLHVTANSI